MGLCIGSPVVGVELTQGAGNTGFTGLSAGEAGVFVV